MEDNNNYQNPQNQTGEQPDSTPQSAKQQNSDTNTYWEGNNAEQLSLYQPLKSPPLSPEQQYKQQYYQTSDTNGGLPNPPKKKFRGALVTALVILLFLCVGIGTAFAFKDMIINSIAKATKNPVEYYAFVEKNNVSTTSDMLSPYFDLYSKQSEKKVANETTSNALFLVTSIKLSLMTMLNFPLIS